MQQEDDISARQSVTIVTILPLYLPSAGNQWSE
jgi:hypothetical protein